MAHSEACQLYIEQQIKEGLEAGKKPYAIGKELSEWVKKLFETSIPVKTLMKQAIRQRNRERKVVTNVTTPTTAENSSEIPKKQAKQAVKSAADYPAAPDAPGPGRSTKAAGKKTPAIACFFAEQAISQLTGVKPTDPTWDQAFQMVEDWIRARRKKWAQGPKQQKRIMLRLIPGGTSPCPPGGVID